MLGMLAALGGLSQWLISVAGRGTEDWELSAGLVSTDQWALTANALVGQSMITLASCPVQIVPFAELFLHQTQHPDGAQGSAGNYEFAMVANVVPAGRAGCHIFLTAPLQSTFITGKQVLLWTLREPS